MKILLVCSMFVTVFSNSAFAAKACNQEQTNDACNSFYTSEPACDMSKPHNCVCTLGANGQPNVYGNDTYCIIQSNGQKKTGRTAVRANATKK